jgi:thiamine-phosphate pyrophosphorylase
MEIVSQDKLRIIDANLNRIGEGLRVLEELARLSLNDADLSQRLKNLRHEIVRVDAVMQQRLLDARDSSRDVGAEMTVPGETPQRDTPGIITANSRRVQESLRVMEELARIPELNMDTEKYKRARFALYSMEKELLLKISRRDRLNRLKSLYVIIDTARLRGRDCLEVMSQVIQGGAGVVQLRDKGLSKKELLAIADDMKKLCTEKGVLFIVNDYLDIALAVDADGLHVGPDDLPVAVTRRLLPPDRILGCSARTVGSATEAAAAGADYIGVGAMFPTETKDRAEVVGTERLREIRRAVGIPLVAIGGINKDNVQGVMAAGANAAAVVSAVLDADDVGRATRQLVDICQGD